MHPSEDEILAEVVALFDEPPLRFGIMLQLAHGHELDDDEQAEWDEYCTRADEAERRRTILGIVDLGEVVENGSPEVEMLSSRLVAAEYQSWYGPKESTKTFVILVDAWFQMLDGECVVWVDKEMGKRNLSERFVVVGRMTGHSREEVAEVLRANLSYREYPLMDCSKESVNLWGLSLKLRDPVLVVVDAQTEVLADAGLNENLATDVERWLAAYVTPARRMGVAVVMLDHVGNDPQKRSRGSGHKGAAAKVELEFESLVKPKKDRIGQTRITVRKNTVDAPLLNGQDSQVYDIGGDGKGGFVFQETVPTAPKPNSKEAELEKAIVDVLRKAGKPLTQNQIVGMVTGKASVIKAKLKELATLQLSEVDVEDGPRGSLLYSLSTVSGSLSPQGLVPSPPGEGTQSSESPLSPDDGTLSKPIADSDRSESQ